MKMDIKSMNDQTIKDTTTSRKMTLSDDAATMVFQMFTKLIYSNPIGTVVREITSNCFDSHVEAGVNVPVVIRKGKNDDGNLVVSFIDFGVGMSPDRVYNIYGTYFESTKRVDNTQIGGFGIGGKTPLAYKRSTGQGEDEFDNSFNVITRFNGIEYTYLIYEGKESPVIAEVFQQETTERNGTEVRVPVLESDLSSFIKEMRNQLYYFENIVFEGFEYEHEYHTNEDGTPKIIQPISNDYQIVRGKNFLFRGTEYSNYMHVCLGKVAYPIDYSALGLDSIDYRLPVALRLEVGDIGMTAAREALDYSEGTIKLLKNKLEDAKTEIIGLIGKQYKNTKTLREYFEVKNDFGQLNFPNGISMDVGNLIEQKDVDFPKFKYQFMKMPSSKKLFKFFFETKMGGKKPKKSRYERAKIFEGSFDTIKSDTNLLYIDGEFKRKIVKQAWLKETHETFYIINKRKIDATWMIKEIADLFNVQLDAMVDANGEPVGFVRSLLEMQEDYMEMVREFCQDYDTLEVPEDFIASRKRDAGITPELRKTSIPVKFKAGNYSRERIKLSELLDYKMPIFYGTQDDEWAFNKAVRMYEILFNPKGMVTHKTSQGLMCGNRWEDHRTKSSIMFIQIAQGNIKHMQYCKNAMHVSQFGLKYMYRKEEKVLQYFQMRPIIEKFNSIEEFYKKGYIHKVNPKLGEAMDEVTKFMDALNPFIKRDSMGYYKSELKSHYPIDDIELTKEQKAILAKIDNILEVQKNNEKTLNYFNLPYDVDRFEDEQITLLQLAMTF